MGLDRDGRQVGTARTDADGTFALDASAPPAQIRIACHYCAPLTVAVRPDEPIVAIVRRYEALLAPGPTARDLHVLPYARVENALALRPFEVLRPQPAIAGALYPALSDRGLARTALILDGDAPAYDLTSLTTALGSMPAHAGERASFGSAAEAYRYGIFGSGGTIAFARDDVNEEMGAYGDGSAARLSFGSPALGATAGLDTGEISERARAMASGRASVFGGAVDGGVSDARGIVASPVVRLSERAASLGFKRLFDRFGVQVVASGATGAEAIPVVPGLGDNWSTSLLRGAFSARAGVVQFEAAIARLNATALQAGSPSRYTQDNTYVSMHVPGEQTPRIDAAIAQTSLVMYDGPKRSVSLPSFSIAQTIGPFELGGGLSRSLLVQTAGAPLSVASLAEARLAYGDGRRFRAEVQTYRRTSETLPSLGGAGVSFAYQLTPSTTLRAWTLRLSGDVPEFAGPALIAEAYRSSDAVWLTQETSGIRVDAIYRRFAGNLTIRRAVDGDVFFPISPRAQIGVRTELELQGRRSSLVLRVVP